MRARILLDIIVCVYVHILLICIIISLDGGSHASDRSHALMGVSGAKLIIYNIVLLLCTMHIYLP